jgi:hypothetical protein
VADKEEFPTEYYYAARNESNFQLKANDNTKDMVNSPFPACAVSALVL